MAGAAAAGALRPTRTTAARAMQAAHPLVYRLARPDDDGELRRLLRGNPFDGAIRVSLECEPDVFAAAGLYGPVHQLLVAEEPRSGRIVAMACRAERDVFVNGRVERLGYLGQLRVDPTARRRPRLLAGGFELCRAMHDEGRVPAYLVSIVEDNHPARRLLSCGRLGVQPALTPLESLCTFALSTRLRLLPGARRASRYRVESGRAELVPGIVECLQRHGRRRQLAPMWTADDLASPTCTPGLSVGDFLVILDGSRVIACAALWDQRRFKQTVVRGYSSWLSRGRVLVNLAARLTGVPQLPPVGSTLAFAFLSHLAIDRDDEEALLDLLDAALASAGRAELDYLVLGLAARDPLAGVVARWFRHRRYVSQLYLAHWPDGDGFVRALDGRLPHPEIAVL